MSEHRPIIPLMDLIARSKTSDASQARTAPSIAQSHEQSRFPMVGCACGLLLSLGAVLTALSSAVWVWTNCRDRFCGSAHLGFDCIPSGVALVLSLDSLSAWLDTKRCRISCYALVLLLSSALSLSFFYRRSHNGEWSDVVRVYHGSVLSLSATSAVYVFALGLAGCTRRVWCNLLLMVGALISAFVMLVSGIHITVHIPALSFAGRAFFVCHLLLAWALNLCLVMDTKHLGFDVDAKYNSIVREQQLGQMHIREIPRNAKAEKRSKKDFRDSSDWDASESPTGTDSDTDLEELNNQGP